MYEIKNIKCKMGFHNWKNKWEVIYSKEGYITGFYYKECNRIGCFKSKCVFNFEESPKKD